jgi:predicted metal-dependent hydrolase
VTGKLNSRKIKIDRLIRSNRKTISLEINREGELIVRAPLLTTNRQIETLLQDKARWIRDKQALAQGRRQENPPRKFLPGERFLYLGESYPLLIVASQKEPLIFRDGFYLAEHASQQAKGVFEGWYKARAGAMITERAAMYAQQDGFKYSRLRISSAKTRWGSCGSKGSINFSWRIIMAPIEVIDYVVVHELVHLKDKSHSKSYWRRVAALLPDYRQHVNWLKENGHRLALD